MPKSIAVISGVLTLTTLLARADDFARALARWQRRPSLASAFHVATSGVFLAGDIAELC